jgi:hypothetical protein
MHIEDDSITLDVQDTRVPGYIKIFTNTIEKRRIVKYFPDINESEKYLLITVYEFTIVNHGVVMGNLIKKMVMMFIMKNAIHICMYYYHGSTMDYDEIVDLLDKFKVMTSDDVITCENCKLEF